MSADILSGDALLRPYATLLSMTQRLLSQEQLERNQIMIYVAAIMLGAVIGFSSASVGSSLEVLIYPVLGILLCVTFLEVPFSALRNAFTGGRFMLATLAVNLLAVPVVVWPLSRFVAGEEAVLLGVLLVLLTPCIDYVIVFSGLGGGDEKLVLAAAPVLMMAQMLTLPAYLWLFMGGDVLSVMSAGPFLEAFLLLIVLPLGVALATQYLSRRSSEGSLTSKWEQGMGYLPVPSLALTLLVVVASQVPELEGAFGQVASVVPIYVAFLVVMALVGRLATKLFGLGTEAGRALIFTGATRNSLVVLPLALALPDTFALTPAIVVTQTLVEMVGMLVYIWGIPAWVLPAKEAEGT